MTRSLRPSRVAHAALFATLLPPMCRPLFGLVFVIGAAPYALAGTPGSFTLFNNIPQFGIYSTAPTGYTPPKGVYSENNGTVYLTKLTSAQRGKIGADVSATVTYLAQCDNYDRIGGLFMYIEPKGVIPQATDTQIELMRWITPFSDYWQGQYATHTFPADSLAAFEGVFTDATKDVWIGLQGGSNPYSGDPCDSHSVTPYFASIGFSYTVSLASTKAAVTKSSEVSAPVPAADYTAVPVAGSAVSASTGNGLAIVIVSGHGSASGGDEYKHTIDTLSLNGLTAGTFNTQANCAPYSKYSPDGNPGIFIGNGSFNPRNWCPGALVPSYSFPVTLSATNNAGLDMSSEAVPSGSYYDTSITLIPQ